MSGGCTGNIVNGRRCTDGGGGATATWAEVLANGNVSGGSDPTLSAGDSIVTADDAVAQPAQLRIAAGSHTGGGATGVGGAEVLITGGATDDTDGDGGEVRVLGGDGADRGGGVTIAAGNQAAPPVLLPGQVEILGSPTVDGTGGHLRVRTPGLAPASEAGDIAGIGGAGVGSVAGGPISWIGGLSEDGDGGWAQMRGGHGGTAGDGGDTILRSGNGGAAGDPGSVRLIPSVLGQGPLVGAIMLEGQLAMAGVTTLAQAGPVTSNDLSPAGFSAANVLRLDPTGGTWTITGLDAAANLGRHKFVVVLNVSTTQSVQFNVEDAGSAAANRFALSKNLLISRAGMTILLYDVTASRWRVLFGTT